MPLITVRISGGAFSGFTRHVHSTDLDSMTALSVYMKSQLVAYLERENLCALSAKARVIKIHCHAHKFFAEIRSCCDEIVYMCDCDSPAGDCGTHP